MLLEVGKKTCKKGIIFQVSKDIGSNRYHTITKTKYKGNESRINGFMIKNYPNQDIRILNKELNIN